MFTHYPENRTILLGIEYKVQTCLIDNPLKKKNKYWSFTECPETEYIILLYCKVVSYGCVKDITLAQVEVHFSGNQELQCHRSVTPIEGVAQVSQA